MKRIIGFTFVLSFIFTSTIFGYGHMTSLENITFGDLKITQDIIEHNVTDFKPNTQGITYPKIDLNNGTMHYDNTQCAEVYCELKNGEVEGHERFEAMAGVPTKENLHVAVGYRGMYVKADVQVYEVPNFNKAEYKTGGTILHLPNFTQVNNEGSNWTCGVNITYSGGGVSGLNLVDGEHSSLSNWVNQQTNNANNYAQSQKCTWSEHTETDSEGNTITIHSSGEAPGHVSSTKPITIPGCAFKDGQPQTITLPIAWETCNGCHHSNPSGSWTLDFSMSHKMNGYMGADLNGNYEKWQSTVPDKYCINPATVNPNNWQSSGNHSKDGNFNHIQDTLLQLEENWMITTSGKIWTAKLKSVPDVSVLKEAKIYTTADASNFNMSFTNGTVVGLADNFVLTMFNKDIARFKIPHYTNSDPTQGIDNNVWGSSTIERYKHIMHGLYDDYTCMTLLENPDEPGTLLDFRMWERTGLWVENLAEKGLITNGFLNNFYCTTKSLDKINKAYKENLKTIFTRHNKWIRECYIQFGDDTCPHGLSFLADVCQVHTHAFDHGEFTETVLCHEYTMYSDEGDVFKVDDIKDRAGNLTSFSNQLMLREIECPTYTLHNDTVTSWDIREASKYFLQFGRENRGYEMFGYSGNYKINLEGAIDDIDNGYLCKNSGLNYGSIGELAYYNSNGIYAFNANIEDFTHTTYLDYDAKTRSLSPKYSSYFKNTMATVDFTPMYSNLNISKKITIKEKTKNGKYRPIDRVECTYVTPDSISGNNGCNKAFSETTKVITSKYINAIVNNVGEGGGLEWWSNIDSSDNPGCNAIIIHNPSSVQYCKVISNPRYMDQRVEDNTVYKGGNSNDGIYDLKRQNLTTDIQYIGNSGDISDRRQYFNNKFGSYDANLETRRETVSFVNLGREFELVFSDQFNIMRDEFDNTLSTSPGNFHGVDVDYYIDNDGNKIYSSQLFGLPTCSDVLGYGWGYENMIESGDKFVQYTSAFPISNKYNEGVHNYVKSRWLKAPFDMTIIDKNRDYHTFKKDQMFNLNDIYQWQSTNENQKYIDIADLVVEDRDSITGTEQIFKHKGNQHPGQVDDGTARDFNVSTGKHKDRLIYGLCLLSNEETPNMTERYGAYANNMTGDATYGDGILDDDMSQFKFNNHLNGQNGGNEFRPQEGTYVQKYLDIVGMIGNICLNDTADFRFSSLFKKPLNNGEYYVDGISPVVDVNITQNVLQEPNNIIDDENKETITGSGKNGDWLTTQLHKSKYLPLPLTAYKNPNEILQNDQLKPGYAQFWDIESVGNYDGLNNEYNHLTNRLIVKPRYYLYDYDDKSLTELKSFYLDNGNYVEGCRNNFEPGDDNFGTVQTQDVENQIDRVNCTNEERLMTTALEDCADTDIATNYMNCAVQDVVGSSNMIILDMNNRNYIGSSKLRGVETVVASSVIPVVNYIDGYAQRLEEENIGTLNFGVHAQKYYFTLNTPSSNIFIQSDAVIDADHTYEYWSDIIKRKNGCIIETMQIQVYGPIWSLEMNSRTTATDSASSEVILDKDGHIINKYRLTEIECKNTGNKLKGEIVAIMDNSANASDDFGIDGLY